MTVHTVLFDIGHVLLDWRPEAFLDRHVGADRRATFFEAVPIMEANARIDEGAPFRASLDGLIADYPDWAKELTLWRDRFTETLGPVHDHSLRLLRALRRTGVTVHALSNFGDETFEMAQREYPFLEEFDRRYISARMGMMKPDPAIYAAVEADCGNPEGLFFTDDRPENIEAAAARGWQVHLFEGAEGLAARFVELGLLTEQTAA